MILIITEAYDYSTERVIEWLYYYKVDFVRVNDVTNILIDKLIINNYGTDFTLNINDKYNDNVDIIFSKINAIWYRRGTIEIKLPNAKEFSLQFPTYDHILNGLERTEVNALKDYICKMLKSKLHINGIEDSSTNKLINLYYAQGIGLKIPNTIISQIKNNLSSLIENKKEYISKAISDFFTTKLIIYESDKANNRINEKLCVAAKTELIDSKKLNWDLFEDIIYPSLLQEKLEKLFEIRTFFLNNDYYSMAIFSQDDEQTKIDFRNYNHDTPNRTVPFIFPKNILQKLKQLMKKLNLNSGSIDMVYTINKEFVFLEVNPIGQYDQVSRPCNYYIDDKIAKTLLKYERRIIYRKDKVNKNLPSINGTLLD